MLFFQLFKHYQSGMLQGEEKYYNRIGTSPDRLFLINLGWHAELENSQKVHV
jgi:hypothetical protein